MRITCHLPTINSSLEARVGYRTMTKIAFTLLGKNGKSDHSNSRMQMPLERGLSLEDEKVGREKE